MLFNTVQFFVFFGVVLLIYWMLPQRIRYMWLLIASYYFYMQWNPWYILLLIFITTVTYILGIVMEKVSKKKLKDCILIIGLCLCLGVLGGFKYANFFIQIVNRIVGLWGGYISWTSMLVLPVGISFYTLQSLGYLVDVYRNDIYAEKNYLKFALYVSFFPQLVAGPIERSKNLLKQLSIVQKFSYENLRKGFLLIIWGLFLKVVIADRVAIFVNKVYAEPYVYSGLYIILATVLFSFQIYCDFYGYSIIARGAALTMGYSLTENFNAPYFSKNIKEFWKRWHISLSSWLKDYLYIPLGGNRKGEIRKDINLLIVFAISGLWHGASLAFVFWGLLNGLYQVLSNLMSPILRKICGFMKWEEKMPERVLQIFITFILESFAWLFFRAGGFHEAVKILKSMLEVHNYNILFDGSIFELGISHNYFFIISLAILSLMLVDYKKYKGIDVADEFLSQHFWFRCFIEIVLILVIFLFGCYGELYDAASFIYFQF